MTRVSNTLNTSTQVTNTYSYNTYSVWYDNNTKRYPLAGGIVSADVVTESATLGYDEAAGSSTLSVAWGHLTDNNEPSC